MNTVVNPILTETDDQIEILDSLADALFNDSVETLLKKAGATPHICEKARPYNRDWVGLWGYLDSYNRSIFVKQISDNSMALDVIHNQACALFNNNLATLTQKAGLTVYACLLGDIYRQSWVTFWCGLDTDDKVRFVEYVNTSCP